MTSTQTLPGELEADLLRMIRRAKELEEGIARVLDCSSSNRAVELRTKRGEADEV